MQLAEERKQRVGTPREPLDYKKVVSRSPDAAIGGRIEEYLDRRCHEGTLEFSRQSCALSITCDDRSLNYMLASRHG